VARASCTEEDLQKQSFFAAPFSRLPRACASLAVAAAVWRAQQGANPPTSRVKDNIERDGEDKLEKWLRINAEGEEETTERKAAHSCAGQASHARDPKSLV